MEHYSLLQSVEGRRESRHLISEEHILDCMEENPGVRTRYIVTELDVIHMTGRSA
jgi:hypothetical protein